MEVPEGRLKREVFMSAIKVVLPDGNKIELEDGGNILAVAKRIGSRLAKAALGGKINGTIVGLDQELSDGDKVEILTFDSDEGKDIYRHSTAHLMAAAVKRLRPEAMLAIGPSIEDGFYYDIDVTPPLTEGDLEAVEAEMAKIVKEDVPFVRKEVSKEEALEFFKDDPYKTELIEGLEDGSITFYESGDFVDLCRGPHLPSTKKIKAFKLLSLAGAYWRGDENRNMLQRIYGTAFPKRKALDEHLELLEEAAKRDHRKLGKALDLFSFHKEAPGFPFFHPNGMIVMNELIDFWRIEHRKRGYGEVSTPLILDRALWEQSGHWDHYKDNMYFTQVDERDFAIKPMNCPGGMLIYKNSMWSYRDLPLRMAELGTVHRHEKSGQLHGLTRVRMFTQDDAHIFMTEDQIEDEVIGVIDFVDYVYSVFGLTYEIELSTRPEKAIGSDEMWENATQGLQNALDKTGMPYRINEGDGAFYGPKIDFHVRDCLKRSWQCATIQLDFAMPEKFSLEYVGKDGERHRPVMIHRVIYGAMERFLAILIEHFAGAFPVWLAPVQAIVIPVSTVFEDYATKVKNELLEKGYRVKLDMSSESLKYKIRLAQTQQIPYMLVVGEREKETGSVSVRHRRKGDIGTLKLEDFVEKMRNEIETKTLDED